MKLRTSIGAAISILACVAVLLLPATDASARPAAKRAMLNQHTTLAQTELHSTCMITTDIAAEHDFDVSKSGNSCTLNLVSSGGDFDFDHKGIAYYMWMSYLVTTFEFTDQAGVVSSVAITHKAGSVPQFADTGSGWVVSGSFDAIPNLIALSI